MCFSEKRVKGYGIESNHLRRRKDAIVMFLIISKKVGDSL